MKSIRHQTQQEKRNAMESVARDLGKVRKEKCEQLTEAAGMTMRNAARFVGTLNPKVTGRPPKLTKAVQQQLRDVVARLHKQNPKKFIPKKKIYAN
jgi:hypothetical protein